MHGAFIMIYVSGREEYIYKTFFILLWNSIRQNFLPFVKLCFLIQR